MPYIEGRASAWRRLGELLKARRAELAPAYVNKTTFCRDRQINYRVVSDIEAHRRTNFTPEMLRAIEVAYELAPGAIAEAIEQGPVDHLKAELRAAHIPTGDGVMIVAVPEELTPAERAQVQQWAERMAEDLLRMRRGTDSDPTGRERRR